MAWPHELAAVPPLARVTSVERSAPTESTPGLRGSDLLEPSFRRPDPALVPAADVARFTELVAGAGWQSPSPSQGAIPPVDALASQTAAPVPELTPADRIAATLRHLQTLRGV